jgi:hypothetical protein
VDLTASFLETVSRRMLGTGLTPAVLAHAAADLLPVDGAGLSTLLRALRLPLGGTSPAVGTAEELQTSLGDGPCLAAAVTRTVVVADLAEMTTRWPVYGEELTRRTPFRSVASVPLSTPDGEVFAALDVYAEDEHLSQRLDLDAVRKHIAPPVSALLGLCLTGVQNDDVEQAMPAWYREVTARRHHVWVAIGMVVGRERQPTRDALDVLRAHAFALELTLDELADDLVEGRLTLDDLAR